MASDYSVQSQKDSARLAQTQADFNKKRKRLIEQGERGLQDIRDQYEQRQKEIMNENRAAINEIRRDNQHSTENLKATESAKLANEQKDAQTRYENLRQMSQGQLEHLRKQIAREKSQLGAELEKVKESEIAQTKTANEKTKSEIVHQKIQRARMQKETEREVKGFEKIHARDLARFRKELANEHDKYVDKLNYEHNIGEKALIDQKLQIDHQLEDQREKLVHSLQTDSSRKDDPFYQVPTLESRLEETPTDYILQVKIPKYEHHDVRVFVQNNKIVIEGNREFKKSVHKGGQFLESSSYQSFHEEHRLALPVKDSAVSQNYKDGILTVTIPKLNDTSEDMGVA